MWLWRHSILFVVFFDPQGGSPCVHGTNKCLILSAELFSVRKAGSGLCWARSEVTQPGACPHGALSQIVDHYRMGDTAQERVPAFPQEGRLWELDQKGPGELSRQNCFLLPPVPLLRPLGIGPMGMAVFPDSSQDWTGAVTQSWVPSCPRSSVPLAFFCPVPEVGPQLTRLPVESSNPSLLSSLRLGQEAWGWDPNLPSCWLPGLPGLPGRGG